MSNFLIDLTDEEITHVYLAVCRAIKNNDNKEVVASFENILNKLSTYVDGSTIIAGSIMKQI